MAKASGTEPKAARKRPAGLGRGLNALLGEAVREEPLAERGGDRGAELGAQPGAPARPSAGATDLATISVAAIRPHPGQPRRHFDEAALEELADSIAQRGVIQPVIVRPDGADGYQLVAGERRWRAAQRAKLHRIPAIVRDLDEQETLAIALIENIQREDLSAVEEAEAYKRMIEDQGFSPKDVAKLVDKSRSHVANLVRLLDLPAKVLDMVNAGRLSMGHARALIGCENAVALALQSEKEGLSVRAVEKLVREPHRPDRASRPVEKATPDADLQAVEKHLSDLLGLAVRINPSKGGKQSGQVAIEYSSLDQLDLICQRLSGETI